MKVTEEIVKARTKATLDNVCDADLCNQYPKMQELREYLTVEDCERIYGYYQDIS